MTQPDSVTIQVEAAASGYLTGWSDEDSGRGALLGCRNMVLGGSGSCEGEEEDDNRIGPIGLSYAAGP